MAGIQDMLTDIRTTGQGVPMGGQPPMGMGGQPPMGRPPQPQPRPNMPNQSSMTGQPLMNKSPMGGGIASMGNGQPPMGGGQPPMGMEEPPMEEPMSVEKDAALLAEATMGRTGGDPEAATAILQTATQMIMSVGQEDPMMMMGGGPLYRNMGGPMYAQDGMPLMNTVSMINDTIDSLDTDTLKQMIADNLRENPVLNSEGANSISPMGYNVRTAVSQLGNDVLGMDVSDNRSNKVLAKDFLQGADGSNPYSDVSKDALRGIYNSPVFNMKKN